MAQVVHGIGGRVVTVACGGSHTVAVTGECLEYIKWNCYKTCTLNLCAVIFVGLMIDWLTIIAKYITLLLL